jgi:subtilase family serine protease
MKNEKNVKKINKKKDLSLSIIIIAVILSFFIHTASADYDFEGVPFADQLKKVEHGSVTGGVIVDGGHGIGNAKNPPYYEQSFSIPNGNIIFSRLYVGVWGGTEARIGTLKTTFNDHEFDTLDLEGEKDTNPEVYCSGHGVYWVVYNATEYTKSGTNNAVARISGTIDRVYGIILVTVYEDNNGEQIKYWINDGNPNLHGLGLSGTISNENNEASAYFSGVDSDSASAARLTVAYLCGSPYENDYLYFNDKKLNGDDVAASKDYFDLLTFDVTDFLEKSSTARFERGDEDYIHPVLAVLTVYTGELKDDSDLVIQQVSIPELYADVDNIITVHIENIGTSNACGFSAALYSDGELVSKGQVSSVPFGCNRSVNLTWKPVYTGLHDLRVMADYTDLVSELRETNNNNTPVTVDILDIMPPNITICSPVYDQSIRTDTITVEGEIEDSDKDIIVLVNGITAVTSGSKWSAVIELEQGINKIIIDAIDESNNTATEFIIVSGEYEGSISNANTCGGMGLDLDNEASSSINSSIDQGTSIFTFALLGVIGLICSIMIIYRLRRRT